MDMTDIERTTLTRLRAGQSGIVVGFNGGHGLVDRLSALGIIPGKRITKISAMLIRGPVTAEIDRTQVAIGFGMADKIVVQTDNNLKK